MIEAVHLPPPPRQESFYQVTLQHADQRKLALWVFPKAHEKSQTKAPTVVFIPGTGGYAGTYLRFLESFRLHFHVVAVDPTGHGRTAALNGSATRGKFTGEQIVEDVTLAATWANRNFQSPVGLLGTSQGGEIAARAMLGNPVVKATVAHGIFDTEVSGGVNLKQRVFKSAPLWALERIMGASLDLRKQLDWENDLYKGAGWGSTFLRDFEKQFGRSPSDEERAEAVREAIDKRFGDPLCLSSYETKSYQDLLRYKIPSKGEDPLKAHQGPVMLITGEHDRTIPPSFIQKVGSRLSSPHKKVVVVKDGYHQLPLHNTEEFNSQVIPFFQAHLLQ